MKRFVVFLTALAIVSGSLGFVVGGLGVQYPTPAVASLCLETEPDCSECQNGPPNCPEGEQRCRGRVGQDVESPWACCGAVTYGWSLCHPPF